MKKLFIMGLATLIAFTFLSCKKEVQTTPDLPIHNLELPQSSADVPLKSGEPVVVKGSGFTNDCQIWLNAATKSGAVQATIIEVTETSIVFSAKDLSGEYDITLKQAGKEFNLGKTHFRVIKRVKTITPNAIGSSFEYDQQGRLIKIDDRTTYQYQEDKIIQTDGYEVTEYKLEKGIIVNVSEGVKQGTKPTKYYDYKYSADYNLISIGDRTKLTWKNGNMVTYEYSSSKHTLNYSEHLNYTTFDPANLLDTRLGYVGNTIKNLVSDFSYEYTSDGKKRTTKTTLEYEFDKDKYPIKATVLYTNSEGKVYRTVYTVTYY